MASLDANMRSSPSVRPWFVALAVVIGVQTYLLAYAALIHAPARDETAHLPAGLSHWEFGRFDLYRVNPPLVRLIAAAPVMLMSPQYDWRSYDQRLLDRCDFRVGSDFVRVNGPRSLWLFSVSRLACVPFALIITILCFIYARRLYGVPAALAVATLWAFYPESLSNGHLITPDMGATALALAAWWRFAAWLRLPTWDNASWLGVCLGLAQASKTTCLVLYPLMACAFVATQVKQRRAPRQVLQRAIQGAASVLLSVIILNAIYGCKGTCSRLESYSFVSETLTGNQGSPSNARLGNRFRNSHIGLLPIPLPGDYLLGVDYVKQEFEQRMWSYLRGEWKVGGWWYYYVYASVVKAPVGFLLCLGGAILMALRRRSQISREEVLLLLPAVAIFTLVSSQTGFNHHVRYVLPAMPFVIVFVGRLGAQKRSIVRRYFLYVCVAVAVLESLAIFPYSHSFFNTAVGGPRRGATHLLDSNVDWGQDLLLFRRWLDDHPEVKKISFHGFNNYDAKVAGLHAHRPPTGLDWQANGGALDLEAGIGPAPGWHALSVNWLKHVDGRYRYFEQFAPHARVGYSILIYHIEPEEARLVRHDLAASVELGKKKGGEQTSE